MDEAEKKIDKGKPGVSLTRREWLLSLGSAVLLPAFPSAPGQAGSDPQTVGAALPPGLYQPSLDHLSHALGSDDPFLPIPADAETEYLQPRSGPFVPQAFTQEEFAVVRRLVEIILGEDLKNSSEKPTPGTPASIYDEVAEWIDVVVATAARVRNLARSLPADERALAVAYFGGEKPVHELETFEPERVCHEGLAWLDEESRRRFGKGFLDAAPAGQVEIVQAISDVRPKASLIRAGTLLFDFLKSESVRGFYTSRVGLKELDYKGNSFYAESPGCGLTPRTRADRE
jgi:hypothetical protein